MQRGRWLAQPWSEWLDFAWFVASLITTSGFVATCGGVACWPFTSILIGSGVDCCCEIVVPSMIQLASSRMGVFCGESGWGMTILEPLI